jgi:hypothetical protein
MANFKILRTAVGSVNLGVTLSGKRFSPSDLSVFNNELSKLKASNDWNLILERNGMLDIVRIWPMLTN